MEKFQRIWAVTPFALAIHMHQFIWSKMYKFVLCTLDNFFCCCSLSLFTSFSFSRILVLYQRSFFFDTSFFLLQFFFSILIVSLPLCVTEYVFFSFLFDGGKWKCVYYAQRFVYWLTCAFCMLLFLIFRVVYVVYCCWILKLVWFDFINGNWAAILFWYSLPVTILIFLIN